ncbi:hybrid sensor histidine kinase/response regulator [Janthinobacterium sp. SUN118]|uniref:hybrid sensor histidine kinase/response regulator n=1 Tax=Janthinobacterium sp. SUN118 TaxID=3004100 RepID=UPI0025AF3B4B|nr:hybrid sensor histidine kinase/response regulator [Janthinobacterium sp. SUN118]MDN2710582.1 hybrid sensor histidine kinase/response regulator [Janthinobacterium sp. SUN118]
MRYIGLPTDHESAPPHLPIEIAALNALHHKEVKLLRETINQLLIMAKMEVQEKDKSDAFALRITQLREANQNLVLATFGAQDLQASAEAATVRQTEFLAMLAHELRNPLQPIAMANDLLARRIEGDAQLTHVNAVIGRQVGHMARLIDDLLDASRVSSGKISLQLQPLHLSDIFSGAVEVGQPNINKRQQILTVTLPKEPLAIDADSVRLTQVFANLIINASKFTPDFGHIDIVAKLNGGIVEIIVSDDGAGIALDLQPFIFDLFTQGFRSLERAQGGLGIGLSLVRIITQLHGGTVEVFSAGVGFGSQFILKFPVSQLSPPMPEAVEHSSPEIIPKRILLIEDNVDAAEMLALLLSHDGHMVEVRHDGPAGLRALLADPYDVIVCDIGLPVMDGYQVISSARAGLMAPLPCFVAASGYSQLDQFNRAVEAGFDHYLVKPINIDILSKIIMATALR